MILVYGEGDAKVTVTRHQLTRTQVEWHVCVPCSSTFEPWRTHRIQVCDSLALAQRVAKREVESLMQSRYKESL